MPDNWSFVIAAYALAAIVLMLYWRSLNRRERESRPRLPARSAMDGTASHRSGSHPRSAPSSTSSPQESRP